MVNLILFLLIFSMTLLQNYIMSAVSHPMGCYLLLTFLLTIELIIVYATWYSQIDRANIIYQRIRQKEQHIVYKNTHEITHGKETLLAIAGFFILAKVALYTQNGSVVIRPVLLIFPPFFSYAISKRYLGDTLNKIMVVYALYVILVMAIEQFSIALCLVLLHPYLIKTIGSLPTTFVYFASIFSILKGISIVHCIWQMIPAVSVIYAISRGCHARYHQKLYKYGILLSLIQPLWNFCFNGNNFEQLTNYLQWNIESYLFMSGLLFIFLRLIPIGWRNEPMSNRQLYFIQSFRSEMINIQDDYTEVMMKKLSELVGSIWIICGNLMQPQSHLVMLFTIIILFIINRVRWVRLTTLLRVAMVIVMRDQIAGLLLKNMENGGNIVKNVLLLLSTYGQKSQIDSPINHPFHLSYKAKTVSYSLYQLLSITYCTLTMSSLVLLPKRGRMIENVLLVGYPLIWFGIYGMVADGRLDMMQVQIYGYVSAEVMFLFYK